MMLTTMSDHHRSAVVLFGCVRCGYEIGQKELYLLLVIVQHVCLQPFDRFEFPVTHWTSLGVVSVQSCVAIIAGAGVIIIV